MRLHANAALTLNQRKKMVISVIAEHRRVSEVAAAFQVSEPTARKWVRRFMAEGEDGLRDRSSAPRTVANRTAAARVEAVAALRRLRFTGPQIAELLEMPESTVSGLLKQLGMGRLGRLGLEPAVRYERERPGELIHIDVKKLGRILVPGHRVTGNRRQGGRRTTYTRDGRRIGDAGWEFVHIAIDDATRLAYAEVLSDEKATTAVAFLKRATAFFARHGIRVERLLTDNGSAYRSTVHTIACRAIGIRHLRTRPRRPQTNGKAERFIRTLLDGWAYGALYRNSTERTAALDGWLWHYNHRRRHSALSRQTPAQRLNNLLGAYT
jgi:transposase InsO family protein